MADKKPVADSIPEIETTLKTLMTVPGTEGYLVFNDAGVPLKWTTSGFIKPGSANSSNPIPPAIVHATALISDFTEEAKAICKPLFNDPEGRELVSLRLHTKDSEYIIAPSAECTLTVIQRAHASPLQPLVQVAEQVQSQQLADEKRSEKKH